MKFNRKMTPSNGIFKTYRCEAMIATALVFARTPQFFTSGRRPRKGRKETLSRYNLGRLSRASVAGSATSTAVKSDYGNQST
eukprot:6465488-Amphidinium_carterae.3